MSLLFAAQFTFGCALGDGQEAMWAYRVDRSVVVLSVDELYGVAGVHVSLPTKAGWGALLAMLTALDVLQGASFF